MVNIFEFATSELSQDAMIAWTLEQFNSEKEEMKQVGLTFLNYLIRDKRQFSSEEIKTLKVELQKYRIDVLIKIHLINGKEIMVIIEDKTYTSESNNQISRYKKILTGKNPDAEKIYTVYYKTGIEFNLYNKYAESDIILIERKDIVDIFGKLYELAIGMEEDYLIKSYYEYIKELDKSCQYINHCPLDWTAGQVVGFANYLHKELEDVSASWENNEKGGSVTLFSDLTDTEKALIYSDDSLNKDYKTYNIYKQVEFKFKNNRFSRAIMQYRLSDKNHEIITPQTRYAFLEQLEKKKVLNGMKRWGRAGGKSCSLLAKEINGKKDNIKSWEDLKEEIVGFFS